MNTLLGITIQVYIPSRAIIKLALFKLHGVGIDDARGLLQKHVAGLGASHQLAVILHIFNTCGRDANTDDAVFVVRALVIGNGEGKLR